MDAELIRKKLTLAHVEVLLLALSLLATVVISALTLRQTTRHFEIERTSSFVARFNGKEMVELREHVDRWIETKEAPASLYERSLVVDSAGLPVEDAKAPIEDIARLRTMANYFQELGTALEIGSLDEEYVHELLGAVCIRYADSLEAFIEETRRRRKRPQAYEQVFVLRARMEALDAKQ